MAFEKKTWYNNGVVPDDAPEGTVTPAFSAANMNRIVGGIDESDEFSKEVGQKIIDAINNSIITMDRTSDGSIQYSTKSMAVFDSAPFTVALSEIPYTSTSISKEFKLDRANNYFPQSSTITVLTSIQCFNNAYKPDFQMTYSIKDSKGNVILKECTVAFADGNLAYMYHHPEFSSLTLSDDETYTFTAQCYVSSIGLSSSGSVSAYITITPYLQETYTTHTPITIEF